MDENKEHETYTEQEQTDATVPEEARPIDPPKRRALLWVVAVILMFSSVIYQRRTGPTYPKRGQLKIAGQSYRYKLIRSEWTTTDARVALPGPTDLKGVVHFKRYKTKDEFTPLPMAWDDKVEYLFAMLPRQPAAGKLEYYVEVQAGEQHFRIPDEGSDNIIIRFKDPVPGYILWPHIVMMFFSVLIGMRAGLGALFAPLTMRRWVWIALVGMTIGGMTLGPIVQKYAFGEYWTGFPFGGDLTDNKMLIMWVAWLFAAATIGARPKKKESISRGIVVAAALVMTAVYLIPHSMRGSELDYSKVDQGIDPGKAIKTGK